MLGPIYALGVKPIFAFQFAFIISFSAATKSLLGGSQMAATTISAGWYADSHIPGQLRYWNGTSWTAQTSSPEALRQTLGPEPTSSAGAHGALFLFTAGVGNIAYQAHVNGKKNKHRRLVKEIANAEHQGAMAKESRARLKVQADQLRAEAQYLSAQAQQAKAAAMHRKVDEEALQQAERTRAAARLADARAQALVEESALKSRKEYQAWLRGSGLDFAAWLVECGANYAKLARFDQEVQRSWQKELAATVGRYPEETQYSFHGRAELLGLRQWDASIENRPYEWLRKYGTPQGYLEMYQQIKRLLLMGTTHARAN
jgi:hypothetical protein